MAIIIDDNNSTEDKKNIVFDNGDWQKAKTLLNEWGFVDIQSMFRAMMSILILTKKTPNKEIALINDDDTMSKAKMSEELFKK